MLAGNINYLSFAANGGLLRSFIFSILGGFLEESPYFLSCMFKDIFSP